MKIARLALVGVLVSVGLMAVGPAQVAGAANCAGPLVVGARGSGETVEYGGTVRLAVNAFKHDYGSPVDEVALQYTAAKVTAANLLGDAFMNSVQDGVDQLRLVLTTRAILCPTQRIVLFGYSQGAMVISRTLQQFSTARADILQRVTAVGLIADPNRVGRFSGNTGSASSSLNGVAVSFKRDPNILPPTAIRPRVESLCTQGDPVCAWSASAAPGALSVHPKYRNTSGPAEVGQRAAERFGDVKRLTVRWITNPTWTVGLWTPPDGPAEEFFEVKSKFRAIAPVRLDSHLPGFPVLLVTASDALGHSLPVADSNGSDVVSGDHVNGVYQYETGFPRGLLLWPPAGQFTVDRVCLLYTSDVIPESSCRPARPTEAVTFNFPG